MLKKQDSRERWDASYMNSKYPNVTMLDSQPSQDRDEREHNFHRLGKVYLKQGALGGRGRLGSIF